MIIPFRHAIKAGNHGKDVIAVKRALSKAGYMQWGRFTSLFGPFAVRATKRFQKAHHLPVNGHVDAATLKKLAPYFDSYGFLLYAGYPPSSTARNRILAYALWGYNNRVQMHYAQRRPMDLMNDLYHLPVWNDCSEFVTKAYKFARAKDPNGNNYNGYGFTGTLVRHGRQVELRHARIGDLVFYGRAPDYDHVAIYVSNGRVISHGSEGGPYLLPIDYRKDRAQIRSYL